MPQIETIPDERSPWASLGRGFRQLCPVCGRAKLYRRYLKVRDECPNCNAELHHQRADDAPPYLTIFIVGHLVIPGLVLTERLLHPPLWVQMSLWPALALGLTLILLPRVKGAVVGLQWAKRMHGFEGAAK